MQFSDIKFLEHNWRYESSVGLYIRGYWVPKSLIDLMWASAVESLPTLDWSRKQGVVTIFGNKKNWVSLSIGVRIALGRCLKYFVAQGMLPISEANPGKKGPRKYVRK